MLQIKTKTQKYIKIKLNNQEKKHMFNNLTRLSENEQVETVIDIQCEDIMFTPEEIIQLQNLKSYIKVNGILLEKNQKIEEIQNIKIEEPICVSDKIIRGGEIKIYTEPMVLLENINANAYVKTSSMLVVKKANYGKIDLVNGGLIINNELNFGTIMVNGILYNEHIEKNLVNYNGDFLLYLEDKKVKIKKI